MSTVFYTTELFSVLGLYVVSVATHSYHYRHHINGFNKLCLLINDDTFQVVKNQIKKNKPVIESDTLSNTLKNHRSLYRWEYVFYSI